MEERKFSAWEYQKNKQNINVLQVIFCKNT